MKRSSSPPYLFISSCHLRRVFITELDFQLNLVAEKHDILPFRTYCCFSTTGDNKMFFCLPGRGSITLTSRSVAVFLFVGEVKDFHCSEGRYYLVLLCSSAAACSAAPAAEKKPFSVAASKHFSWAAELQALCGVGYLSEGFWRVTCFTKKKKRARA